MCWNKNASMDLSVSSLVRQHNVLLNNKGNNLFMIYNIYSAYVIKCSGVNSAFCLYSRFISLNRRQKNFESTRHVSQIWKKEEGWARGTVAV